MLRLDRRSFIKMVGGSAAALGAGIGFSEKARAKVDDSRTVPEATHDDGEWEYYYPGRYSEADKKVLAKLQAQLDQINNRKVDIGDLVGGKLNTREIGGPLGVTKITHETMMRAYRRYGANNPIFHARDYAKQTRYGDLIAFPMMVAPEVWCAMPTSDGFADYMVVNGINCANSYYKPYYEGDILYQVIDQQHCVDITPEAGSRYRTFAMSGTARVFNQRGELVAENASLLKESFRRHRDPAKRNPSKAHAWESPDWWSRKPHIYTDADWEEIIGIWKNEVYRGREVLYWDDVNIGDEPPPRAAGPFLSDEVDTDMLFNVPDWSSRLKQDILDPKTFAKMVKNRQGIYVLPEYLEKKPKGQGSGNGMDMPIGMEMPDGGQAPPPGDMPEPTPEIANRDGRAVIQNAVCPKWAAGMLINWMGDAGWLQRIGWDIMALPPGYPESVIPRHRSRSALFDKFPYLEKVPYMRGIRPAWHALEGDTVICRSYVTDKYSKDGEYFADLVFWCQTIDKYLVEEGFATVKLPKK